MQAIRVDLWAVPSLVAVLFMAGLTVFVLSRRPPSELWPALPGAFAACSLFALGDLFATHLSWGPRVQWAALVVLYTGLLLMTSIWWSLGLRFSNMHGHGVRSLRPPWVHAPAAWNLLLWLSIVTNPWHGLFLDANVGSRSDFRLLWYVMAASSYSLIFASTGLFLRVAARVPRGSARSQSLLLAAATAIPLFGSLFYVLAPDPLPLDPVSIGMCVSCSLFVAGIYRDRLFSLSPVAIADLIQQESDATLLLDREGRLLHANPVAWALFTPSELVVGSDALAMLSTHLREPEENGGPPPRERLLARDEATPEKPNGSLFRSLLPGIGWIRIHATVFRSRNGHATGYYVRVRDESALRAAMEEVTEQTTILDAILNSTGDGFVVAEKDGRVRYSNARNTEILGMDPAEFRPQHIAEAVGALLPKMEDPGLLQRSAHRLFEDPTYSGRGEFRMRDGRVVERVTRPLLRDGAPAGRIWRLSDVTERWRAQESLVQAQKLESLRVMAGGIAHDFNNLLMAIMGNSELAAAELPPDSAARSLIENVSRAAERAGDLTRQLLHYAGRSRVVVSDVDLTELVEEARELLAVLVPKHLTIHYELAPDLPRVTGDATQLRQALMNLVMNAVDAIGKDAGEIWVTTGVSGDGGASGLRVNLKVRDTGCGMDSATQARIFDPFFTTKFTGRGLGLAAVQGIVRAHDADLKVESEPGNGTCFTLLLPCATSATVRSQPGNREARSQGGSILVVDDEPGVASIAARNLRSAGFDVLKAQSGEEAIAICEQRASDIAAVLLDLTMPGLSGEATWQRLKEIDPDVRVVLTSGYPEHDLLFSLDDEGHASFLQKPYHRAELLDRIRKVIGSRPS